MLARWMIENLKACGAEGFADARENVGRCLQCSDSSACFRCRQRARTCCQPSDLRAMLDFRRSSSLRARTSQRRVLGTISSCRKNSTTFRPLRVLVRTPGPGWGSRPFADQTPKRRLFATAGVPRPVRLNGRSCFRSRQLGRFCQCFRRRVRHLVPRGT